VHELAVDVLAHRMVLSFEAVADGATAEQLTRRVLEVVPPPRITAVTGGPGLGAVATGEPRPVTPVGAEAA
jgi:MoxR-like ATPase